MDKQVQTRPRPVRKAALAASVALLAGWGCGPAPAPADPASSRGDDEFRELLKEKSALLDARSQGIGRRVPDLAFEDVAGTKGRLSELDGSRATAIVIRDVGCPVSRRIAAETARVEDDYAPRGVAFLFVNPSDHNTVEEMEGEIEEFGFDGRYAVDRGGAIARALGARTTCEIFLVDRSRTLVYRGAVDDRVGRGVTLPEARRTFLRDALDAVLAGERVVVPATSAPGCLLGADPLGEEPQGEGPAETGEGVGQPIEEPSQPTYHEEISRILQRNCVECHREGGAGPFSLETYAQARGRGAMVRFVVRSGIMPPWFASDGTGPSGERIWENDRRLSEQERETLLAWIEAGFPEGDPADGPLPLAFRDGWQIGEPDLVFQIPEPFPIPAEGVVDLTRFFAETKVPHDVWVQRMQVLPSDPTVVHHATVMFKPPEEVYAPEERIVQTLLPWTQSREGFQFLLAYLPGKDPKTFPEGVARFVPAGSTIRFEMHYTPNGVATEDQTAIGLVLADEPPELQVRSRLIRNLDVFVPAGAADVVFSEDYTMPFRGILRSLTPHMHLRGRTFDVDVVRPDGSVERVLTVPEWDPDWQFTYTFRDPPLLEPGTRIHVSASFDNSSANPNNPDPTQDVHDGPQIWDEMLVLVAEWILPRPRE